MGAQVLAERMRLHRQRQFIPAEDFGQKRAHVERQAPRNCRQVAVEAEKRGAHGCRSCRAAISGKFKSPH